MRSAHGMCAALSLAAVLVVAGCGGGGTSSTSSSRPAAEPAGWARCTSVHYGFSMAYPRSWHVASYNRLHVLGKGDAYRKKFFRHVACLNYDPRPFTVSDGTEFPPTAVTVSHIANAREYRRELRSWFQQPYVRMIWRHTAVVGGHQALRFHVYLRRGAPLWDRSHVYGYVIDLGRRGGLVIEAWRYGFEPIPWKQYRSHMALVDRMAPTARVVGAS